MLHPHAPCSCIFRKGILFHQGDQATLYRLYQGWPPLYRFHPSVVCSLDYPCSSFHQVYREHFHKVSSTHRLSAGGYNEPSLKPALSSRDEAARPPTMLQGWP